MRQLLLLRHAKSSWQTADIPDRERPLNRRGADAARLLGDYLLQAGLLPDLALVSSATRTEETWHRMSKRWPGHTAAVELLEALYLAAPSRLLAQIRRAPQSAGRLLVVGHNPGLEALAARLAGPGSNAEARARLARKYPTGGLALFAVTVDRWGDLAAGRCRLERFVVPRDLAAPESGQGDH